MGAAFECLALCQRFLAENVKQTVGRAGCRTRDRGTPYATTNELPSTNIERSTSKFKRNRAAALDAARSALDVGRWFVHAWPSRTRPCLILILPRPGRQGNGKGKETGIICGSVIPVFSAIWVRFFMWSCRAVGFQRRLMVGPGRWRSGGLAQTVRAGFGPFRRRGGAMEEA